jgi:hypothetical protein
MRQVDFWLPCGSNHVASMAVIPRVGENITWSGQGDYVVTEVHHTMMIVPNGCSKGGPITITLEDRKDGRQFDEWQTRRDRP